MQCMDDMEFDDMPPEYYENLEIELELGLDTDLDKKYEYDYEETERDAVMYDYDEDDDYEADIISIDYVSEEEREINEWLAKRYDIELQELMECYKNNVKYPIKPIFETPKTKKC